MRKFERVGLKCLYNLRNTEEFLNEVYFNKFKYLIFRYINNYFLYLIGQAKKYIKSRGIYQYIWNISKSRYKKLYYNF